MKLRVWPDYSYVREDEWDEEEFRFKGSDYWAINVPGSLTDDEIDDFINSPMFDAAIK